MKKVLPIIFLILLTACQQVQKMTPTEKKLVGEWQYDNVDYWPLWGSKDDLTNEQDHLVFQFNGDFTMTMLDLDLNESYTGIWEVNITSATGSEVSSNATQELIASLSHDVTGDVVQLIWENLGVTNSRINATHDTKDGYYSYRLRRN
jgi:hypothetical protein